ncbi:uncharacterized protein BDR25DRAFT_363085 [Lindgomyces ingoldianus]|uniref:Uncharacterized protein n=1 Tax=Lindgomyces ingoldianus TaxID=673940 RepID=A0ACB6Q8H3_9PLEO|nr:uncharacterized protein BDR25DRAFT_363085 [Lindgomyces ingoldianus]KAF2463179.1 hypothetical protein BDR25DRAFT_363085 [Lindgomyces ingoldianus]
MVRWTDGNVWDRGKPFFQNHQSYIIRRHICLPTPFRGDTPSAFYLVPSNTKYPQNPTECFLPRSPEKRATPPARGVESEKYAVMAKNQDVDAANVTAKIVGISWAGSSGDVHNSTTWYDSVMIEKWSVALLADCDVGKVLATSTSILKEETDGGHEVCGHEQEIPFFPYPSPTPYYIPGMEPVSETCNSLNDSDIWTSEIYSTPVVTDDCLDPELFKSPPTMNSTHTGLNPAAYRNINTQGHEALSAYGQVQNRFDTAISNISSAAPLARIISPSQSHLHRLTIDNIALYLIPQTQRIQRLLLP